jgi:hypothetical protein
MNDPCKIALTVVIVAACVFALSQVRQGGMAGAFVASAAPAVMQLP